MSSNYRIDTKTGLDNLKPRNPVYWHKLAQGWHVGYRKTKTGGSWHARHTDQQNGNARAQKSLGSDIDFDQASQLTREFCKTKNSGVDTTYTVAQALEAYVEHRTINKNAVSGERARQTMDKHVPKSLQRKKVHELKKGDLRRWLNGLISGTGKNAPVKKTTANKIASELVAALNMCFDDDVVDSKNAWLKVRFPVKRTENARKEFFTAEQEQTLLNMCNGQFKVLVEAALLIGARPPGELSNLRVQDFDAEKGTINITADALFSGKTGERVVYLSYKAVAFFKAQVRGKLPRAWIIPKDNGDKWSKHCHFMPWAKVRRRNLELPKAKRIPQKAVMYTCRHTYISRMVTAGVPILAIAKNTGTSVQMIQDHYGHFAENDMREMLNRAEG